MSLLVDSARRGAADRQAGLVLRIDNAPPRASACGRAHRPQDSTTRRVAIISAGPRVGGSQGPAEFRPDGTRPMRAKSCLGGQQDLPAGGHRSPSADGHILTLGGRLGRRDAPDQAPSIGTSGRASERRSRALWDGVCFVGARREPSLWWREDPWSCSRPTRAESDECRRAAHHEGGPPAMKVIRIVPNLSSEAFVASRAFYTAMFDLVVSVELDDWYLQLMPESDTRLNIGFVKPDHELFAD